MESDQRFSAIKRDPRFRLMSKRERKVKIDKRFTKMFTDRNFKLKYTVDKRGRPVDLTSNDHLQRYYELSSSEHGTSDDDVDDKEETAVLQASSNEQDSIGPSPERPITAKVSRKPVPPAALTQSLPKKQKGIAKVAEEHKPSKTKKVGAETTSAEGLHERSKRSIVVGAGKKPVATSQRSEKPSLGKASKDRKHRNSHNAKTGTVEMAESRAGEEGTDSEAESEGEEDGGQEDDADDGGSETESEDNSDDPRDAPDQGAGLRGKPLAQRKSAGETTDGESSEPDRKRAKLLSADGPDYARGEGALSSSESDSDDSFYDASALDEETVAHDDHYWGEIDKEAEAVEEPTTRLAVCNMDWDRIKAIDLMVLLNSFKPTDGVVKSVKIFPSDYGLERMKEEEVCGPKELNAAGAILSKDEANLSQKELEKKQTEWLRLYQLNRLKYYYAVVECDSTTTASHIYEECDGLEYESSSTKLDLRYIPWDMTFDDREATSEASTFSDLSTYKPSLFVNTALNQSKVDCTWDETNKDRLMVTNKKFKKEEIETMDLKMYSYVASSSESGGEIGSDEDNGIDKQKKSEKHCLKKSKKRPTVISTASAEADSKEDDDDEEAALNKYRSLLQEIEQKESGSRGRDGVEMEITWEPGLKDEAESLVEHKVAEADGITVWDKYLEKRRDKRKQKLEQKKARVLAEEADDGNSLHKQQGKRKKKGNAEPQLDEKEEKERAELSLLVGGDEDDKKHFSMKKIINQEKLSKKKKRKLAAKQDTADNFEVDLNDPRFSAVYTSHLYNIDPSAQEFKKTKASTAIIEEKLKRRAQSVSSDSARLQQQQQQPPSNQSALAAAGSDPSLAMLVKSVKAKAKHFKQQKTA